MHVDFSQRERRAELTWLPVLILVAAVAAAYAGSWGGVFVFDDLPGIVENPTLRPGARLPEMLFPSGISGGTVGGRPLLNLSLALNFALGGLHPAGYHGFNLAAHAAAALLLFGLIRRTLARTIGRTGASAIGLAVALLWSVHPLQTEAVTYVIQRAEVLAGLLYLFALYAFARATDMAVDAAAARGWLMACWAACAAGMAAKETMATAPLVILLYDRTFRAGSFRAAWRSRKLFYGGLACTWLPLALLVSSTAGRGGSVVLPPLAHQAGHLAGQARAISHYLRLALWPSPLVFDYGFHRPGSAASLTLGLACGAAAACFPRGRFLAACFLVLLAPSSSVFSVSTQPAAEHRMYLPLACLILPAVMALYRICFCRRRAVFWAVVGLVAAGLAAQTIRRNEVYRSQRALWEDTVAKVPQNPRARTNLGVALAAEGDPADALSAYAAAVKVDSRYLPAEFNLGAALVAAGRNEEAIAPLRLAVADRQYGGEAELCFGECLSRLGRPDEALPHDAAAARHLPREVEVWLQWGNDLAAVGRYPEAVERFRHAVALAPDLAPLRRNLEMAESLARQR